jgi:hypothetical protein
MSISGLNGRRRFLNNFDKTRGEEPRVSVLTQFDSLLLFFLGYHVRFESHLHRPQIRSQED